MTVKCMSEESYRAEAAKLIEKIKLLLVGNLPDMEAAVGKIRREMAWLGWSSKDDLSDTGWGLRSIGYSIWFERWHDWSGEITHDRVSFHHHNADPFEAPKCVLRAAWDALERYNGMGRVQEERLGIKRP